MHLTIYGTIAEGCGRQMSYVCQNEAATKKEITRVEYAPTLLPGVTKRIMERLPVQEIMG